MTNNISVHNLAEPLPEFGIGHVGSLERLAGTPNGTQPVFLKLMQSEVELCYK